jgi:group I intron endonuclease
MNIGYRKTKIYKITNLINNFIYIGKTYQKLEVRWKQHLENSSNCRYLKHAIEKYGKENFVMEEIFLVFDEKDVKYYEDYFINYYNSLSPNGYNLMMSLDRGVISEETSDRLSASMIKRWSNCEYREKTMKHIKNIWTKETKEKQSASQKEAWKKDKKRLKGIQKYIKDKQKPILGVSIYDGSVIKFNTINEARENGYNAYNCLTNGDIYSNGYTWFYFDGKSDEYYINLALQKLSKFDDIDISSIKSIDKKTQEERIYKDLNELKIEGLHEVQAVKAVLRGRRKTYHNRYWYKIQ